MTPRGAPLDGNDPRHGTIGGYCNHGCRCPHCTEANSDYCRRRRAQRRAAPKDPDDPRHGTPAFYGNHGCRCGPCTAAWTADSALRKQARTPHRGLPIEVLTVGQLAWRASCSCGWWLVTTGSVPPDDGKLRGPMGRQEAEQELADHLRENR